MSIAKFTNKMEWDANNALPNIIQIARESVSLINLGVFTTMEFVLLAFLLSLITSDIKLAIFPTVKR